MDTTLLVDHHPLTNSDRIAVRALLTLTGTPPDTATRTPLALSVVLDASGSMLGDPIAAAREAARMVAERLHPDDHIGVVAFDDVVEEVAPMARRREHTQLAQRIAAIDRGGSTNLSGGWLRGREQLAGVPAKTDDARPVLRRVLLLTDGHANCGITDVDTLVAMTRGARAQSITTSTLGFGEGYDDALLRAMADAGNGSAWYIERVDQMTDIFAHELGELLSVAAQNVRVTLTLAKDVELVHVHSTWTQLAETGTDVSFDLGDLYASEPKPLLLELVCPSAAPATSAGGAGRTSAVADDIVATLTIAADVLTSAGLVHRTITLAVARSAAMQHTMVPTIEEAILAAKIARAREDAARHQRNGDEDAAARLMSEAIAAIEASPLREDPAHRDGLAARRADLDALRTQYHERQATEFDAKYQMQRAYNARRGKRTYDQLLERPVEPPNGGRRRR